MQGEITGCRFARTVTNYQVTTMKVYLEERYTNRTATGVDSATFVLVCSNTRLKPMILTFSRHFKPRSQGKYETGRCSSFTFTLLPVDRITRYNLHRADNQMGSIFLAQFVLLLLRHQLIKPAACVHQPRIYSYLQ